MEKGEVKCQESAKEWRLNKIKELEEKQDKTEFELSFLEWLKSNDINIKLRETFFEIINILDYYMEDTPENILFYAVWLIGTYYHKEFYSYPYLFLNAMRGSGKSRLLKLLSILGYGRYTSSITEPIIFRTQGLLCIDELESIGGKDKSTLRELLNASYKKGMTIMRTIKKKGLDGENMKIEEFEPYRPIAMANIWGMEEVLGDRCITRILEKSNNPLKTKRVENFDSNLSIQKIKVQLVQCSLCSVDVKKTQNLWNEFLDKLHLYTNNNNNTNYTNYTFTPKELEFYKKIDESDISGRNLELFLPILIIANIIGEDIFESILDIAKKMSMEKKENEYNESYDVSLYHYIADGFEAGVFYPIKTLTYQFRGYMDSNEEWLNERWIGKALKRLCLIIDKKRVARGVEVTLNISKAKEKIKMFKV